MAEWVRSWFTASGASVASLEVTWNGSVRSPLAGISRASTRMVAMLSGLPELSMAIMLQLSTIDTRLVDTELRRQAAMVYESSVAGSLDLPWRISEPEQWEQSAHQAAIAAAMQCLEQRHSTQLEGFLDLRRPRARARASMTGLSQVLKLWHRSRSDRHVISR